MSNLHSSKFIAGCLWSRIWENGKTLSNRAGKNSRMQLRNCGARLRFPTSTILVLVLLPVILSCQGVSSVKAQTDTNPQYPSRFGYELDFLDFRESDHSANISVFFESHTAFHSAGPPEKLGLDLRERDTNDYSHQERNGSCDSQSCSVASWYFDFSVRFRSLGVSDLYPYDSYMFNITLEMPLLSLANKTNTEMLVRCYAYGWELKFLPITRVVTGYIGFLVVTAVLQRDSWTTAPVNLVPVFLFLILGMTVFIPSKDLSSKVTVCTAVLFFIAASIFTLGPNLPPRVYGLSFAETTLYYLLLISSAFLVESILENRAVARLSSQRYVTLCFLFQIGVVFLAISWINVYTNSFETLASNYWWASLDLFEMIEAKYGPMILVALGLGFNFIAAWREGTFEQVQDTEP